MVRIFVFAVAACALLSAADAVAAEDIDCELSEWTPQDCDAQTHTQVFTRTVVKEVSGSGRACDALTETRQCDPNDCQVSAWSDWSECEAGYKSRTREVLSVQQSGGRECPSTVDQVQCQDWLLSDGALSTATATQTQPQVTVNLPRGASITGTVETNARGESVHVFRGIRYAEARTGKQRWTRSKLITPTGNIDATKFANKCYTDPRFGDTPKVPESEDCLFLNVYRPAGCKANSNLPVMIWTHGGSWVSGNGYFYDGRNLVGSAGNNVIYVSFNYRLGIFGFLANQELLKEGNGANFALRDMELAHQWVRKNIQSFGGNPNSITAFGESAGAMMIALQLVTNGGKQTIFDKALLESGSYPSYSQVMTVKEQDDYVAKVAAAVNCTNQDACEVLACLRTTNAADLMAAGGSLSWRPVVDNKFLVDLPYKLVQQGKFSNVPTVLGTNTDEGFLFTYMVNSEETFQATFPMLSDEERAELALLYPVGSFYSQGFRAGEALGDVIFVCPSETLSLLSATTPPTPSYHYRFSEPVAQYGLYLAIHTAEMRFVFNDTSVPTDAASLALAASVGKFWTNFARYSSPNGASDIGGVWPRYGKEKQQILLQKEIKTETNGAYLPLHTERCVFWNKVEARIAQASSGLYTRA